MNGHFQNTVVIHSLDPLYQVKMALFSLLVIVFFVTSVVMLVRQVRLWRRARCKSANIVDG